MDKLFEELFYSDPEKIFSMIYDKGNSLDEIKNIYFPKKMIKERFPELLNQDTEDAVEFVFWFTYFVEREIRNTIIDIEKNKISEIEIEQMIDDMVFGEKIKFIEDNYETEEKSDYIKILREIKNIRNHLAHGRLNQLEYGGYSLSDPRAQLKLLINLTNSCIGRPIIE